MILSVEPGAAALLEQLHRAGHRAYVVGGCVRDSLLGLPPHDWDLCTSASPQQVLELFGEERCIPTGLQHGTVTVKWGGQCYEVTTFRTEGAYTDGRHPDRVAFVPRVEEDLARRDFTINAMAYAPEEGLVDPFGGQADLAQGLVRAVGQPERRFEEDGLRILRLYRFGARFGFRLEESTRRAARALCGRLGCVSAERIEAELTGLLSAPRPGDWLEPEAAAVILPELEPLARPERFAALCRQVDRVPPAAGVEARLAVLLAPLGEQTARQVLRRLRCSRDRMDQTALLVARQGLTPAPAGRARQVQARRLLGQLGPDVLARLLWVCRAQHPEQDPELEDLGAEARSAWQQGACCRTDQLAVNGRDLLAAGIPPGPEVGRTLQALLDQVVRGSLPNQKQSLLAAVRPPRPEEKER